MWVVLASIVINLVDKVLLKPQIGNNEKQINTRLVKVEITFRSHCLMLLLASGGGSSFLLSNNRNGCGLCSILRYKTC